VLWQGSDLNSRGRMPPQAQIPTTASGAVGQEKSGSKWAAWASVRGKERSARGPGGCEPGVESTVTPVAWYSIGQIRFPKNSQT
jgi:hypothetical protein